MAPVIDISSSSCSSGGVHGEDDESEEARDGGDGDSEESPSGDDSEWEPEDDLDEGDDVGEEEDEDDDGDDDDDDDDEEEEEEEEKERGMTNRKRKRKNSTVGIEDNDEDVDEEELCDKVVAMLQRRKDVSMLKLDECKAYLRKHGLRLTGSKSVCIQRIQEHWRLGDGNGEKLYPKSSFAINCTGDVCTGDVILFKQRVYDKYDKVTRGGNIIGRRTIAGKVVKESYGAAKQQHTFTVEILWSRGVKPLPALYPLLVKGRNLYRLRTSRQRWDNEIERSKVLAEKHKRGAAARHIRAIEKAKSAKRGSKHHKKSHDGREFTTKWRNKEVQHKDSRGMHKKHLAGGYNIAKPRFPESAASHSANLHPHTNEVQRDFLPWGIPPFYTQYRPQAEVHHGDGRTTFHVDRRVLCSSTYGASSSPVLRAELYNQALNRTSLSNHFPLFVPNSSGVPQDQVHFEESFRFPVGMQFGRTNGGGYRCRTPGCWELAGDGCLSACCWMCCRRIGRRCNRHQ